MATKNSGPSSRTTSSTSPRVHASGSNSSRLARKSSKRKHRKKSSKSRSDKGAKKTKFSSPFVPQGRPRRRPSSATSASQSRFCPHRKGRPPSQFPTGRYPGFSRNHPLLVPSISSFYPPGAAPLAPGTPVSIPGLPPLIAGNPVPLPPGFFPPSPFMGLAPPVGFGAPMMGGGGAAQQPIVLPFPIPMPMPMPTSGGSHPPIVIPAPPPPHPPSYPSPMPYPVAAPAAQGGGGSDNMAIMMMMKSMQQERQVAAQEREREEDRRQEEKKEDEKRQQKKEKEEEKKRKKKEKEEERKRKKEEREKALEERKKEIERMQEENRRQIEEAQKAVEEAAAKKKAEKAEAMAKKAAEEEEAKKKREEEEKARQEAAAAAAAEAEKEAAAAQASAEAHPGAAGEEHPLLAGVAGEGPPDPMAYYAPPANVPALDLGVDINPALQITEPRGTGRLLCFIVLFLIVFLGIVVALLYFLAPDLLPFLETGKTTAAAGAAETTPESSLRGEVINIDNPPIKSGKRAPGEPATTPTSSARAFTVTAGPSTRAHTEATAVPLDANTIEIALNDRQWAGATERDDGGIRDLAATSSAELKRTPDSVPFLSAFPPPGVASSIGVVPAKGPQAPRYRRPRTRPELGNQSGNAMPFVTALTLGAFLDQGYRQNLKARLFAEDSDGADKKAASRKRPTFDYDNIWNEDDGEDKVVTAFTFEGSTKSAIRELLESVQRGQHDFTGARLSPVSPRSPQVTRAEVTPVIADESVNAMSDEFTTESETMRAGAVTLEDFKIYTVAHVNPLKGAFEKAFKELKNTRKRTGH